jgi:hypothetical protein
MVEKRKERKGLRFCGLFQQNLKPFLFLSLFLMRLTSNKKGGKRKKTATRRFYEKNF